MTFKVFRRAAYARVAIENNVESHHIKMVREGVNKLIHQGFTNFILDLTQVGDSHSHLLLSILSQLLVYTKLSDGVCIIVSPGRKFMNFLGKTGLETFINIVATSEESLPCLLARIQKRYDQPFFKMLIDRKILKKSDLKECIGEYRAGGEQQSFGSILMERQFLTIDELLDLLAVSMKTAPADLEEFVGNAVIDEETSETSETSEDDSTGTDEFDHLFSSESSPETPEPAQLPPIPSEFVTKSLFGEILVENGFITEEQLRSALEIQRNSGGARVGDILIEQGYLANDNVFDALKSQIRRRGNSSPTASPSDSKKPAPMVSEFIKPSLFGEILLELGLVTEDQLKMALDVQNSGMAAGRQLGEILVEMGAVTHKQIIQAAEEQANRKN